jgi:SAM-dependent methyltransferase
MHSVSENLQKVLACSYCNGKLQSEGSFLCNDCETTFPLSPTGQPDFRLTKERRYITSTEIGKPSNIPEDSFFSPIETDEKAEVDFSGVKMPKHLFSELASYIPKSKSATSIALDVGCGKIPNKDILEHAGYEYCGIDYREPEATLRGDAHALPLQDNSIDIVMSLAVLEHLRHPQLAVQEIERVLKPGGRFVGSVAFLHPFHDYSYNHLSHLGMYNLLATASFEVEVVAPCRDYSVLMANAHQLFRQMNRKYSIMLVKPLVYLHKMWWKLKPIVPGDEKLTEIKRLQKFSGGQHFVARKRQ